VVEFGGFSTPSELTEAELVELTDTLWEIFNERDWDRFFELTKPDFTAQTDPLWPDGGTLTGKEENIRFLNRFLEPWEALDYERREAPELINERLVERGSWIGTGRATGIDGRIDFTVVVEMTDGLVSRMEYFIDHAAAMEYATTGERPA
jgi:hypothetical protein